MSFKLGLSVKEQKDTIEYLAKGDYKDFINFKEFMKKFSEGIIKKKLTYKERMA